MPPAEFSGEATPETAESPAFRARSGAFLSLLASATASPKSRKGLFVSDEFNPYEAASAHPTTSATAAPSQGLTVAALILAVVMPVVGLILALVAHSRARRTGTPISGVLKAALIVAGIMTGAGLILGLYMAWLILGALFGWSFAFQNASPADPNEHALPGVVMIATWADGSRASDIELEATRVLLSERLDRAGLEPDDFHFREGTVRVTLGRDFDEEALKRAAEVLSADIRLDFRQVFSSTECDPATRHPSGSPAAQIALCDRDRIEQLVLAPSELSGESIVDAYASELTTGGASTGTWVVTIEFDSEGTKQLATLTERLFALGSPINRFAIVFDGKLLTAPTVNAIITDGKAQIAGAFDEHGANQLADELNLAARGLRLTVESVTPND